MAIKTKVKKTPKKRAFKKVAEEMAKGIRRVHPPLSLMTSSTVSHQQ